MFLPIGTRKPLALTLPSEPRALLSTEVSTLSKALFGQEPDCHELPEEVTDDTRVTCELPTLPAAMLFLSEDVELLKLKPTSPLSQAVLRSTVSLPGLPLSMKPFFALLKAILFFKMWFAGGLSVMPKLEAVSIAVEVLEVPAVEAIAPGIDLFQGDSRAEHEEIEAVVDVIPQASVAEDVALA
jgi:hypothetical protein